MSTQVPPSRLDSTKDFSSLVPSAFAQANAAFAAANSASGAAATSTPRISSIVYPGDDTAAATAGGQTVTLNGAGFNAGASVLINGSYASVVSVANSTSLSFTTPSNSGGTYILYVINTDGGTGISVPGISYSGTPSWSNAAGSLATVYETTAISNSLTATGDPTISYSLFSGTLPPGSSLNSSTGLLSGTSQGLASSTTYNFTIRATDGQNQDTDRAFSITINPDVVTWSSPSDNSTTTAYEYAPISNVTMSAASAAGKSITFTANALPTGVTITGNIISGTPTVVANTFTQLTANAANTFKTATKDINFVVNPDVVTWSSPADGTNTALFQDQTMSNVTLSATSAAGKSITYTANALPTGVSINGANVSGTPTVVGTTNSLITATAATTNRTATRNFTWVVSVANDTYFKNTTLLLNGETTSNTFVSDASTNNLGLTINGDTKPTLFNPYKPGYYSNYFDGSNDYLTVPSNTGFGFGTGDFTIEFWFNGPQQTNTFFCCFRDGTNATYPHITTGTSTGKLRWGPESLESTTVITDGKWHHCAITREPGIIKVWVDGVMENSTTYASTNYSSSNPLQIGKNSYGTNNIIGYISNLRVVKGTSLYTSTFTPSTTPLTAISGTSLLTCQSNRFIDNSTNNFTITKAGDVSVSPNIPFTANSSYSTYGSTYFDGTGDTLYIPSPTTGFSFGTGEFTIEMWVYKPSALNTVLLDARSSATANPWVFVIDASNFPYFYDGTSYTSSVAVTLNSWNHVAVVRTSGVLKIFVNGVQGYSASYGTNLDRTAGLVIGDTVHAAGPLLGYISDLRIVKGTAVYTTAFTPPTAPLTAITNTQLLTLQYNGGAKNQGIIDNSNFNNIITRAGNTSQGTFSPYSVTGWSNYFDGTGDYLSAGSNSSFAVGTGDFTFQVWVYPTAYTSPVSAIFDTGSAVASGRFSVVLYSSGLVYVDNNTNLLISSSTLPLNAWTLISIIRSSGTMTMYFNGTSVVSGSIANNFTETQSYIGRTVDNYYFQGYISNLRLVKGTALANTVPTSPLTAIANTVLLTCQSNRFIDNSPNSFTITKNGDTSVQAFDPFGSISEATPLSYSNFFDGTGDYLSLASTTVLNIEAVDFTIEAWINMTVMPTGTSTTGWGGDWNSWFIIYERSNGGTTGWQFRVGATLLTLGGDGDSSICWGTHGMSAGNWYHVAVSRQSGTYKLFVNGTSLSLTTQATSMATAGTYYIGSEDTGGAWFNGHISNLRVIKGTALYTTAFTPSTTPLTAIANTSLLTCQSTTIVDNSPNVLAITTGGDTKPRQFNPFGYTAQSATSYTPSLHGGSAYFDGTTDYLSIPSNVTQFTFGTGNFTIEFWLYLNSTGQQIIWDGRPGSAAPTIYYYDSALRYYTNAADRIVGSSLLTGQWYHIALCRSSTSTKMFINGTQTGSTYSDSTTYTTSTPIIGADANAGNGSLSLNGYLSDVRVTKGTAIYTSNFVPPTQTLTNYSTNIPAQLLLNFNNGGIIDQHGTNVLETVGNAQLSTAVKKYNNASMSFDGTGDYLSIPSSPNLNFGTGDFTIESWLYPTSISETASYIFDQRTAGSQNVMLAYILPERTIEIYVNGGVVASGGTIALNSWSHFAITRASNSLKMFLNGTQIGSTYSLTNTLITAPMYIGTRYNGTQYFNGYMDDFRVTKGYARYTTTFTPPTTALITK